MKCGEVGIARQRHCRLANSVAAFSATHYSDYAMQTSGVCRSHRQLTTRRLQQRSGTHAASAPRCEVRWKQLDTLTTLLNKLVSTTVSVQHSCCNSEIDRPLDRLACQMQGHWEPARGPPCTCHTIEMGAGGCHAYLHATDRNPVGSPCSSRPLFDEGARHRCFLTPCRFSSPPHLLRARWAMFQLPHPNPTCPALLCRICRPRQPRSSQV